MDSCWKETPAHIIQYILKLACSRLIYRDNRYIEIKDVVIDNVDLIHEVNVDKYEHITDWSYHDTDKWWMEVMFKKMYYRDTFEINHGIIYEYNMSGDGKLTTVYKINLPERYKLILYEIK